MRVSEIRVTVRVRVRLGWLDALKLRLAGAGYIDGYIRGRVEKDEERLIDLPGGFDDD